MISPRNNKKILVRCLCAVNPLGTVAAISDGCSLAWAVLELEVVALRHRVPFSQLFKVRPR